MADTITIKFNYNAFVANMERKMAKLKNKAYLLRPVAIELIPLMTRRIHINGKAADGSSIGKYAASYMPIRKKHKRTEPQNKVVVALTSQLENEWAVIPTANGYGIGFTSPLSANKARWVEQHFQKEIFSLSKEEEAYASKRFKELISDALSD